MYRRNTPPVRASSVAVIVALATCLAPPALGAVHASAAHARGCRAWSQVFRPIVNVLSVGKVLVALPTFVPGFAQRVYPHANVLNPPLTYDVALSTHPGTGWPVSSASVLLWVHGSAGMTSPPPRSTMRTVNGKRIELEAATSPLRGAVWADRRDNVTYRVSMPTRMGMATLLRVAGSLTTGRLRVAPITAGAGRRFNSCP